MSEINISHEEKEKLISHIYDLHKQGILQWEKTSVDDMFRTRLNSETTFTVCLNLDTNNKCRKLGGKIKNEFGEVFLCGYESRLLEIGDTILKTIGIDHKAATDDFFKSVGLKNKKSMRHDKLYQLLTENTE
jgi:midasin (ATPase involved in ribosome maturation)